MSKAELKKAITIAKQQYNQAIQNFDLADKVYIDSAIYEMLGAEARLNALFKLAKEEYGNA